MRILITNDDGIGAEGLRRLAAMAAALGEVWVVAPAAQCSAMSQRITLREKLRVEEVPFPVPVHRAYQVTGTPADCVKVALWHLMEERPDLVFSGMNYGYNAGFDIAYSGTVGAAMEGIMNGIPSIAFSNQAGDCYEVSERYLAEVAQEILAKPPLADGVWNVNFPGCGLEKCPGVLWDRKIAKLQYYRDNYEAQEGGPASELSVRGIRNDRAVASEGSDYDALRDGYVSVGVVRCSVLL